MHLGSSQTCLERKSSLKALSLVRHPINDSNIYSHSEAIKVGFCRGGGAGSKTSFAELSLDGNFRTWALLVLCHFFHSLKLNIAMKPLKEEETYVAEADYQSSMTLYTEMWNIFIRICCNVLLHHIFLGTSNTSAVLGILVHRSYFTEK